MSNETNNRPRSSRNEGSNRPATAKKSSPLWVFLLPLALLMGTLWQFWRESEESSTPPADNNDNAVATPRPRPTPTPKPKPTPQPTPRPKPAAAPVKLTLFVPNENGELQRSVVTHPDLLNSELPTATDTAFSVLAAGSLGLLFKKAPENFPPGTKLLGSPKLEGDVARVNLSKEFQQPEFWQGSTQTQMTVYSIVNTVAAESDDTKPVKVQFLVEGKPIDVLGELDVSEPLEPDMTLVASS